MGERGTKCRKRSTASSSAVIDADGLRLLGAAFALFGLARHNPGVLRPDIVSPQVGRLSSTIPTFV